MVLSLPMRRHLPSRRNGIVPLVAMSLPLPMHRHLAVVDDDGNSATGDSVNDNCDSAKNVNNDGDGATDDDIDDNDCDGQRWR
jgi:hypothetical protein